MKVLVATEKVDPRTRGFSYTVPGEIVYLAMMCDTDARIIPPADGDCGCGRSFTGLSSHHATTLAEVAERELTPEDYIDLLVGYMAQVWPGEPDADDLESFVAAAVDTIDIADEYDVGTVLVRSGDEVAPLAQTP